MVWEFLCSSTCLIFRNSRRPAVKRIIWTAISIRIGIIFALWILLPLCFATKTSRLLYNPRHMGIDRFPLISIGFDDGTAFGFFAELPGSLSLSYTLVRRAFVRSLLQWYYYASVFSKKVVLLGRNWLGVHSRDAILFRTMFPTKKTWQDGPGWTRLVFWRI